MGHLRIIALLAHFGQLFLHLMIVAQQGTAGVGIRFYFIETVAFKPLGLNAFREPREIFLLPQQFAPIVIDQRNRGALHIEILGDIDVQRVVFPFGEGIEQVALAAQQTEGGFIEADAVANQRHHTVGQ